MALVNPSTATHVTFDEVADALRRAGIHWALLRLPKGGPDAPEGDVDLLVQRDDLAVATATLEQINFVRVPRPGHDVHLLRYVHATDRWTWLHITTDLTVGADHQILNRRMTTSLDMRGIPRLQADVEFWSLLWHCLAEKRCVAPHHREALRAAAVAATCDSSTARAFAAATGDGDINARLLDAVIHDDWRTVESSARPCRSPRPAVTPARVVASLSRRIDALRHCRVRRGLSVAVLGPDGAGKTTLAAAIAASVPFPSRIMSMGLTSGFLRNIRRLRVPVLVFLASTCVLWGRYVRAWLYMMRGGLVIFDRYVYDAVAPPGYDPGRFERSGRRLYGYVCPSPDLVLLLDAPGEVMYARKGAYDAGRLEFWRQRFLSLKARLAALEIIDATQAAADVRRDALSAIWRRYVRQWDDGHSTSGETPS